jgi:GNAT superfamily N-acetyltransferase
MLNAALSSARTPPVNPSEPVRGYAPTDRADVLAFRRAMYGPESFKAGPRYLEWALDQPHAAPGAPAVWLYRTEGEVRGQVGGYRTRFQVGGARRTALWVLDLVVDPNVRQRGIGKALAKAASDSDLTLSIDVSADAGVMFRRLGWSDLGDVPLHVRPLTSAFFEARSSRVLRLAARPVAAAMRGIEGAWRPVLRAAGLDLVRVRCFDERSDEAWARAAPGLLVASQRDRAFLEWRFGRFPMADRYGLYYLMQGAKALGHAVLRTETRGRVTAGHVVDFACEHWAVAPLLALASATLRARGADVAYCLCASPFPATAFAAAGFGRHASGWPLFADLRNLTWGERLLAARARGWFVTAGDSNIDRPREFTAFA